MEVGRKDSSFHPRVGAPLVCREKGSYIVQAVSGASGGGYDRTFDFFTDSAKCGVNRRGVALEDELCHIDNTLAFTREYGVWGEGNEKEQPNWG